MPGTIHVSVLDFSDLPSTSSSSVFFKVSMGKREYQTVDKGDFSFPVKSLREKLILLVLDDDGSKLCQTVVEAILVVQKGVWDDYFSLDDGGLVHMRLQFVLSDDDRIKIRKMRESALQKKCRQLLITHPESTKAIGMDVAAHKTDISVDIESHRNKGNEAIKTNVASDTVSFRNTLPSVHGGSKGDAVSKDQANPNGRSRTEEAMAPSTESDLPAVGSAEVNTFIKNQEADKHGFDKSLGTMNSKRSNFTDKGKLFVQKADDQDGITIKDEQMQRIPSSVRKMISAFEFNSAQDTISRNKPPPLKIPITKLGFENPTHDLLADEVIVSATKKLTEMGSEIVVSPSFFSELRQKVKAKKRQISYGVVEIITIAPERGLAEATADELVTSPLEDETCVSAVDAVDILEVPPFDMRAEDMTSFEDDTRIPIVETEDGINLEKELQNKDMEILEANIKVEKNLNKRQCDLETKFQNSPQYLMRCLNDETEKSISTEHTLFVTKDGSDREHDQTATATDNEESPVMELVADDIHNDNQNSGGIFSKLINEKKHRYEDPQDVKMGTVFNKTLEPADCLTEWLSTCGPPCSWAFPDEPRVSCIAPSSTQLINPIGGCNVNASIIAKERCFPSAWKPCHEKRTADEPSRSPGINDSADGGNPNGQFAQAIKIAIMVAFGALLFFSRQRNHR